MDIKIEWQQMNPSPYWSRVIEERLKNLQKGRTKIIYARMTLRKNQHHSIGAEEATIVMSVPGRTLTATKAGETMPDAINAVLEAIEREWRRHREKRQHNGQKAPAGTLPEGVIAKIFRDRDYGFIQADGTGDIYFHKNSVRGISFKSLKEGTRVEFDLEAGHEGWQASRVVIK